MAGMFYTLQEVVEKLGKTEAEIKTLVREGKLREFRDGAKQLYKVEDVEALMASPKGDTAVLDDSLQLAIDETGEVSLAPEELDVLMSEDAGKNESKFKLDETGELVADETLDKAGKSNIEEIAKEDTKPLKPAEQETSQPAGSTDIFVESPEKQKTSDEDTKISLSSESINVLGESDTEFKISEDTSGETKLVEKGPKTLGEKGKDEMSVARLDEDVNLEGVSGSGSGLLDLSLQADDTSLGAVLDDIYPETPAAAPAEQAPAEPEVVQEAEKIFEQAEAPPAEQAVMAEAAAAPAAALAFMPEPPPDITSNAFGITLFVPLLVLIYTSIEVVSGYKPISNLKILSALEPIIWYVAGGVAGLVILIVLIGSFIGKGGDRPPKVKQPKPPKEKKVKKEKKAKEEKESSAKEG
jgi:hypothetical protein